MQRMKTQYFSAQGRSLKSFLTKKNQTNTQKPMKFSFTTHRADVYVENKQYV